MSITLRGKTLYGIDIVRSGLTLHVDAASPRSYSGTGTAWNDLSEKKNNATLINGPTYSNGVLTFDGSNDYAEAASVNSFSGMPGLSLCMWVIINSGYGTMISKTEVAGTTYDFVYYAGVSTLGQRMFINSDANPYYNSNTYLTPYTWTFISMCYSGSKIDFYLNGQSVFTSASSIGTVNNNHSLVRIGNFKAEYLNGKSSAVYIYNRYLSSTEILQNYNATKSRHGL